MDDIGKQHTIGYFSLKPHILGAIFCFKRFIAYGHSLTCTHWPCCPFVVQIPSLEWESETINVWFDTLL